MPIVTSIVILICVAYQIWRVFELDTDNKELFKWMYNARKKVWKELYFNKFYYLLIFTIHTIYVTYMMYYDLDLILKHSEIIHVTIKVLTGLVIILLWASINAFIYMFNEKYRYDLLLMPIICIIAIYFSFFKDKGNLSEILCGVAIAINNVVYLKILINVSEYMDFKANKKEATLAEKYILLALLFVFGVIVFGTTVLFIQEYIGNQSFISIETNNRQHYYLKVFEQTAFALIPFGNLIIDTDDFQSKVLTWLCIIYKFLFTMVFVDAIISKKTSRSH